MKQKKTMKLWQMLALAGICLGLILNMFLPLWNISGTKLADWAMDVVAEEAGKETGSSVFSGGDIKKLLEYASKGDMDLLDKRIEEFDDSMEEAEKKLGFNLASMSGFDILTLDVNVLLIGDKDYTKEDLEKYEQRLGESDLKVVEEVRENITNSKILFGIEYGRIAVILIFILLGFFLKWNKLINSIICAAFGGFTMTGYGIVWWGLPSYVLNKFDLGEAAVEKSLPYVQSFWGAIVGIGIIVGFILGVLLLAMGLVSCFVGKPQESMDNNMGGNSNGMEWNNGWGENNGFGWNYGNGPGFGSGAEWHDNSQKQFTIDKKVENIQTPPKAGRVKCTQGVAMGQGYKLPADRKVIVGKSPQNATLVIHDPHVSNIHCSIRYRAETNSYIIKDHSTNGTFVNGIRLGKDVAVEYPAGTVLSLADGANKITLG